MQALADRKELRADILVPTTGLKHRIAVKKSWQSAADDLQTALDEGETDPDTVVKAFLPDERVRLLDAGKLWAFLIEGEFWTTTAKGPSITVARKHIAYLIDRALVDKLVTPRDVVDGISVGQLTSHLPRGELSKVIQAALDGGRNRNPFTDVDLLAALPIAVVVEHVPLGHIYEAVVNAKIAKPHDYLTIKQKEAPAAAAAPETAAPDAAPAEPPGLLIGEPPAAEEKKEEAAAGSKRSKPPGRGSKRPPSGEEGGGGGGGDESEWVEIPESVR